MKKLTFLTVVLGLLFLSTAIAQQPGDTLWTRAYGGEDPDFGYSGQQTNDGGYIAVGYTRSFGVNGSSDVWLLKIDTNGDTAWTCTYGGSDYEHAFSVQQTEDSGYIIAGCIYTFAQANYDVYMVKTDVNGEAEWIRIYGGSGEEYGYCVQQTSDGGYIVAGRTDSYGAGSKDMYVLKTDANGDIEWTRTYGGSGYDNAWSVQQTIDGGYIIGGYGDSYSAGGFDAYIIKTDSDGDMLWSDSYGGSLDDYAHCIRQTADGGYIFFSYTTFPYEENSTDFWIVRLAGQPVIEPVPTLSEWGMIVLGLLILAIGTAAVIRRRTVIESNSIKY